MDYSENQKRLLHQSIYNGNTTPLNLPDNLYKQTALHLTDALEKGAGINFGNYQFGEIGKDMAYNLRENVYLFSGAKTFQYVLSTKNLIIDEAGQIIPFNDFEKLANDNFNLFHKKWLQTEYATAQISAKNIVDFKEFEANAEFFPFLKYRTLHDANVSEVCKQFDGVVKRVGSDWFKTNAPQNHYNCRCYLEPMEDGVETNTARKTLKPTGIFAQNPAETGKIFTKEHPYFDVPPQFEKFAKNNFNLDIPNKPKPIGGKIELEGFKGKQNYGTLSGRDLETQQRLEEVIGIKVPDKLVEGLEITRIYNSKGGYWIESRKTINLGDYKTVEEKAEILAHELGHAIHYNKNQIIKTAKGWDYSDEFKEVIKEFKNEYASTFDNIIKRTDFDTKLIRQYFDKKEPLKNRLNAGGVYDCIGDLTKGKHGGGHAKKYYKDLPGMELFAHLSENYFVGNEVFRTTFPLTYKKGLEYFKKLLKDE